jgi:hypothetical protein
MSHTKPIIVFIKMDGKAIDVTYQCWIEIHKLIQECNSNRKKILDVIKKIIECHYGQYTSIFNKIQLNHHWKTKIKKIVDTWQQYVIHSYCWPKKSHGSHKWQYTYGQSKDKIIFYWFFFFHPQSMSFATMVACNLTFAMDLNDLCCLQLKPMGTNCIIKKKLITFFMFTKWYN